MGNLLRLVRPVIFPLRATEYRRSNSILWHAGRRRRGGADVVEETRGRIYWRGIGPKHNRFGADDRYGIGWWMSPSTCFFVSM